LLLPCVFVIGESGCFDRFLHPNFSCSLDEAHLLGFRDASDALLGAAIASPMSLSSTIVASVVLPVSSRMSPFLLHDVNFLVHGSRMGSHGGGRLLFDLPAWLALG